MCGAIMLKVSEAAARLVRRAEQAVLLCAIVLSLLVVPSATAQQIEPALTRAPTGLSDADWASIRAMYDAHQHAVVETDGGFGARNPAQAWVTTFDQRGFEVRPDGGGWMWGLELAGYGWGGVQAVGEPMSASAVGGRFERRWDVVLSEWCINDGRGLEHGFTLSARPVMASGVLTLDVMVRGGLRPVVSASGRDVRFVDASGAARGDASLTYNNLTVFDATGRTLDARWAAAGNHLRLTVDDLDALYPLTIDPIAQQAYLKASNTQEGDLFGVSIAIDGDTIVVGAIGEDSNASGVNGDQANNSVLWAGAAYVFVRDGADWTQQAYLKASNPGENDSFGWSVAIYGDTIVVGAPFEDSNASGVNGNQADDSAAGSGAAYVFVRSGSTWTQQAYLKASNTDAGDAFGSSVAVRSDTIVVGAPQEASNATGVDGDQADNSATWAGAAYVFVRDAGVWTQQAYLKASNTDAGDLFGSSVALTGDRAAIGAYGEASGASGVNGDQADNSAPSSGAVYVFARSGAIWTQEAYLKASNTDAGDVFGYSLAMHSFRLVVGAPVEASGASGVNGDQADNSAPSAGAAYVFVRSSSTWTQEAYLKASNPDAFDDFGIAVAISGARLVVGALLEASSATGVDGNQTDNSAINSGAAYVFVRDGSDWTQHAYLKASNTGAEDRFGSAVALSGDSLVVGAYSEDSSAIGVNGNEADNSAGGSGAAYALVISPPTCRADLNGDGIVDFFDVQRLLSLYASGNPGADITGDGIIDFFDIQALLSLYAAGCP